MKYVRFEYRVDWQDADGEWHRIVYLTGKNKGNIRYWGNASEAVSQAVSVYNVPRGANLCVFPKVIEDAPTKGPAHEAGGPPHGELPD